MPDYSKLNIIRIDSIYVSDLLNSPIPIKALNDETFLDNRIINKYLNRPQLALTGYMGLFNYKSIQLIGNTENFYINSLSEDRRIEIYKMIMEFQIPCFLFTGGVHPDKDFLDIAKERGVAVLETDFDAAKTTLLLSEFLDDQFASQAVVHGSFVDVHGVGILFTGRSGIGKSEIALDLIERGHRLVADDVVMLTKKSESILMGTGTSMVQHFMEIRGLGIIDVRQMFGIRSIRFQKRLEIIVELMEWNKNEEYNRVGLDEQASNIIGVDISTVKLPIFPGKNITVIAETISINYLLRTYGYNAAKEFTNKLKNEIQNQKASGRNAREKRSVNWFRFDKE
jgi:HPr kinase/phosphorylase